MLHFLLQANLFQVQDYFGNVFRDAFKGGKLMVGAGDIDPDDRVSLEQRVQQHPAQGSCRWLP